MSLGETNIVYIRYRITGGKMKLNEKDTGAEEHYKQWSGIELIEGDWGTDYNNLAPCELTNINPDYVQWYQSTHPKPIDVREATRNWLNRRAQLHRKQRGAPGSYLRAKNIRLDVDDGVLASDKLWRMNIIRKQDDHHRQWHICHRARHQRLVDPPDQQLEDDDRSTFSVAQSAEHLLQKGVEAAIHNVHLGATRLPPSIRTDRTERDWDFFYSDTCWYPQHNVQLTAARDQVISAHAEGHRLARISKPCLPRQPKSSASSTLSSTPEHRLPLCPRAQSAACRRRTPTGHRSQVR